MAFGDALNFISIEYSYKINKIQRIDYFPIILIILGLKYNLNKNLKFLEYNLIKMEMDKIYHLKVILIIILLMIYLMVWIK